MKLKVNVRNTAASMLAVVGMISAIHAQEGRQRDPQVVSPEVREGGKVVFRLWAPEADSVRLVSPDLGNLETTGALNKNEEGVWQLEYGPITPPRTLRYKFEVDGVQMADPSNRETSEANGTVFSTVFVPGLKWMELQNVPHGAVSEVVYHSKVLDRFRRMHVYTPPGYDSGEKTYPVFYLLHGATDSDDSWSTVGRANVILDNLIAAGDAVPMVVVMPDGHVGRMGRGRGGFRMGEFVKEFTEDIVPHVRKNYRVHTDRSKTAIAGLSMGGGQTLGVIGQDLANYGYIGVFSSGIFGINRDQGDGPTWEEEHLEALKDPELKTGLELFWFATGRDDFLVQTSRDTVALFKKHDFDVIYEETEGSHTWINWRDYLQQFAPMLFRTKSTSKVQAEETSPFVVIEDGGTGSHPAVATEDWTLPGMTIFRPRDLSPFGQDKKLPILLWGNGACANTTQEHKNFLSELASNGYVIVAIGLLDQIDERGEASRQKTQASQLLTGLDWILAENQSTESIYFGKVEAAKVASMGMSCGGLQAIQISADPRITITVVCNSGVLPDPSPIPGMPPLSKDALKDFHGPVLYLMGGPSDIAYKNAMDDFARVDHVPIVMTNLDVGHAGTYARPHGGEYTPVALAWLDWQLKGRKEASGMFLGEDSTLKRDPEWSIETKNFDQ